MQMKVISIANNYGKPYDGVGAYAEAVSSRYCDSIHLGLFTGDCRPDTPPIKRITNLGMHKAFGRAMQYCRSTNVDYAIVEYPFVEWNPVVIRDMEELSCVLHAHTGKLVLSVHEYERLNPIRKKVVELLAERSDGLLVTSNDTGEALSSFCSTYKVRAIPSNIDVPDRASTVGVRSGFVYFGIVNKAKAFKEMLTAWDSISTHDGELSVITASELGDIEAYHNDLLYYKGLGDEEIVQIMTSSVCCVLPILPVVDGKNTTFATAARCGCLCIGRFCQEYAELPFTICVDDYTPAALAEAFSRVSALSPDEISRMSDDAFEYGKRFSADEVARDITGWLEGALR